MKHLLTKARNEILDLRRQRQILEAQVEVVHIFAAALGMRREGSGTVSIDIAWELEIAIQSIEEKEKAECAETEITS